MFKPCYPLILSCFFITPSFASQDNPQVQQDDDDDIVISASRVTSKRIENGSSITVFDQQYLQENQNRTVAEILHDVPGLSIASNGGFGKKTSVFIRGASSENTVVIIDGVKVSDHSSANGGFDFSHLMTANIESIEVLRGPQSAIWGSDAMGGVINITTKKGQAGFHTAASLEFGSNKFNQQVVNINGATESSHYSLSASNLSTDGISAKTGEFDDPDDDAYENQNISLKAGHQFNSLFAIDTVFSYTGAESEYDVNLFPVDSGINYNDNYLTYRQRLAKINSHLDLLNDRWKNRLSLAYSDSKTENYEPQGWSGPYTKNSGEELTADLQSDYFLNSSGDFEHRFTLVAEIKESTFQAWSVAEEQKMDSSSVVGEYATDWTKTVFLTTSLRRDFNSDFANTTTHKIALTGWINDGIRLHASQGAGVKNPTFSQLYGSYATPDLNPETSNSWDFGVEYNFATVDGYIDMTYFNANYDDAIRWDPNAGSWGGYVNQDEKTDGLEISSFIRMSHNFRMNGQVTYLNTSDGTSDKNELLRRPKHSASINANYQYTAKLSANIGARYVGDRLDYGNIDLESYTVINIAATYQIHPRFSVYGRIENALDKDYVEVTDYGTEPLTAYIGINFK